MRAKTSLVGLRRWVARHDVDLIILFGLSVAAYVVRRLVRPWDGLWYDDAWVAGGAVFGSIGDVAMTGGAHPGFTMLLWLQHHLVGGPVERLALVPFVVGVLGPAIVYGCLRSLRYERTGCLLVAAALVVTSAHVIYSGHVKPYTLDVAVVMVVAALLPRLASRRWSWWGAVGWVGFAVVIGSFSGYQMLASAMAIALLVLHSQRDRLQRFTALVVQGLLQGGWVLYSRRFVDMAEIEAFMESGYDAHVERSTNPIVLGQNVFKHFERVIDVHPGAPAQVLGLLAVGVVVGLVLGAVGRLDGDRALVSQFALAALVVAAVGGVLHLFPFGPRTSDFSTVSKLPGARHSLWLIPMTSIGLCNLVDLTINAVAKRPVAQTLVRLAVIVSTVALVTSRWQPEPRPGVSGTRYEAGLIDKAAASGAFIVLDQMSSYSYLVLSDRPVHLVPTPDEMVGYLPVPHAAEGVVLGMVFTPSDVAEFLATTEHEKLVIGGLDLPYDAPLKAAGWQRTLTDRRGHFRVTVWQK